MFTHTHTHTLHWVYFLTASPHLLTIPHFFFRVRIIFEGQKLRVVFLMLPEKAKNSRTLRQEVRSTGGHVPAGYVYMNKRQQY